MFEEDNGTVSGKVHHADLPLVFLKESSLFGDRPPKAECLTHIELYQYQTEFPALILLGYSALGGYGEFILTIWTTRSSL